MELNQDRFYIVRTKTAGVFFGKIKNRNGVESVTMSDVRKLWYWDGAAAVEQLALNGITRPDNCKFTVVISEMEIAEPIQIIPCTEEAAGRISAVKTWKM